MEDALARSRLARQVQRIGAVLILVLMEDALAQAKFVIPLLLATVLILVLMEDALAPQSFGTYVKLILS